MIQAETDVQDADPYSGPANDVWSLGILLIKLLGRDHPYAYKDAYEPDADWRKRMIGGCNAVWDFCEEELEYGGIGQLAASMLHPNPLKRMTVGLQLNLLLIRLLVV